MIITEINPCWLDAAAYVRFLSQGFAARWDLASFEWYLRRPFDGQAGDIAVRADGTTIVAGIAYSYRHIEDPQGRLRKVCVMGAGTTLARERGKGHYDALMQVGLDLCRQHGCCALLGFTTRQNASARGMKRLGAYAIPSFYIASGRRRLDSNRRRRFLRPLAVDSLARRPSRGVVGFYYPSVADWKSQFLHRPHPIRALRIAHDSVAIVETVGDTNRLQWLQCPEEKTIGSVATLAAASTFEKRDFFMYTLDPVLAKSASRLGLKVHGGLLNVLAVDPAKAPLTELARARWHVHSGDRM